MNREVRDNIGVVVIGHSEAYERITFEPYFQLLETLSSRLDGKAIGSKEFKDKLDTALDEEPGYRERHSQKLRGFFPAAQRPDRPLVLLVDSEAIHPGPINDVSVEFIPKLHALYSKVKWSEIDGIVTVLITSAPGRDELQWQSLVYRNGIDFVLALDDLSDLAKLRAMAWSRFESQGRQLDTAQLSTREINHWARWIFVYYPLAVGIVAGTVAGTTVKFLEQFVAPTAQEAKAKPPSDPPPAVAPPSPGAGS